MKLRLLSPKGSPFQGEVLSCLLPAEKGPTEFSSGTTRMIVSLSPAGIIQVKTEKGNRYFTCFGGVANMAGDELVVSSPLMEEGSSIDATRALESKKRAEQRLQEKNENIDQTRAKASLLRALTRLSAKSLSGGGKA